MWIINGKLPQEEGGLIVKAIEEVMRLQNKPMPDVIGYSKPSACAETPSTESADPESKIAEPKPSASAEAPSTESANPELKIAEPEHSASAEAFSTELGIGESELVETATFAQKRADGLSAIV